MSKKQEKIIYDVEVLDHPEFGLCFNAVCPDCGMEIRELTYMKSGNVLVCKCPREWAFILKAVGVLAAEVKA